MAYRMNPPGIPHLYAATDLNTAFEETRKEGGEYKIAEIELNQEVNLIDLSNLPPIPSMFDPDPLERGKLGAHTFIHRFENAINSPIARDDEMHLDYVPSQIFCEYIKKNYQRFMELFTIAKSALQEKIFVCLLRDLSSNPL